MTDRQTVFIVSMFDAEDSHLCEFLLLWLSWNDAMNYVFEYEFKSCCTTIGEAAGEEALSRRRGQMPIADDRKRPVSENVMEQMRRLREAERALNEHINSRNSGSCRSEMSEDSLVTAWTERRELFRSSIVSIDQLTLMVRAVLRSTETLSVVELATIFYGAERSDLQEALNRLVEDRYARLSADQRYAFVEKAGAENRDEIVEEMENLRRFRNEISSGLIESSNGRRIGCSARDEHTTHDDGALVSKLSTVSMSEVLRKYNDVPQKGDVPNRHHHTSQSTPKRSSLSQQSADDSLTIANCLAHNVKLEFNNPSGPMRLAEQQNDESVMATSTKLETSKNDSGVALSPSMGKIRCATAEDYIRRTSSIHSVSSANRTIPSGVHDVDTPTRYRWTKKANDPVQNDPVDAIEKFCRLRGLSPPGYTVTYMPQEKIHLCVLQVNNRAFRSYPTMALSHKRATEVAAEKAVAEFGITQKMLEELEEQTGREGGNATSSDQ